MAKEGASEAEKCVTDVEEIVSAAERALLIMNGVPDTEDDFLE